MEFLRYSGFALLCLAFGTACPDDEEEELAEVCCQQGSQFTSFFEASCPRGSEVSPDLCTQVCCQVGGLTGTIERGTCEAGAGTELGLDQCEERDAGGGEGCTCNAAGARFTVVSGCQGAQFNDATTADFCRSAVQFVIEGDPDNHEFDDGAQYGFPECQVRITCP